MKSSIIIPVYNQFDYTRMCLQSIKKNNLLDYDYEIIVINNGSTDGTVEYLANTGANIINNKKNIGVAKAWNQGIKKAKGEYLFIINNDIIVCRNWIKNLVDFYERNENTGILSPATREGELNYEFNEYAEKFIYKMKEVSEEGFFGWCMIIKKDRFEKIGLFSQKFEIGIGEDTDFYLRLKNKGYKSYITGSAFVHHFGSKTLNNIRTLYGNDFEIKNISILMNKWNIREEPYFKRKLKSFVKFIKNFWYKIFYGYTLYKKS